jgi:thiamine-monophosphate kinase
MGSPKLGRTPVLVEDEVVERIRNALGAESAAEALRDDAALLAVPGPGNSVVVSVDSVVENIHFDLALSSPQDVGWKALMGALSDLAAMAARPLGALVALCVPGLDQGDTTAVEVMAGVAQASAASGCPIIGGDVSGARELTVVVTVLGVPAEAAVVNRAGARPGDRLFVTGPCGGSAAGLRQLRDGKRSGPAVDRHRRPVARLAEGEAAARAGAHAMIDVSDGLALDLHRMADESAVGFSLSDVPIAEGATRVEALGGGEDYELVLAVEQADTGLLAATFRAAGLAEPSLLGEVLDDASTRTLNGRELGRLGFQHGGAPPRG